MTLNESDGDDIIILRLLHDHNLTLYRGKLAPSEPLIFFVFYVNYVPHNDQIVDPINQLVVDVQYNQDTFYLAL